MEDGLIEAIRAEPDARETYLVYGDWLAQRGDPHGELIGLMIAAEREPAPALAKRIRALQRAVLPAKVDATWRWGFVRELRVGPRTDLDVLAHPALRFVESIAIIDRGRHPTQPHAERLASALERAPRALLRRLEVGHAGAPVFATIGALQRVLEQCPRLAELALHAQTLPAGLVEVLAPRLCALELASETLPDRLLEQLAGAAWPELRALTLHVPSRARDLPRSPLAAMMSGRGFPRLVDLRVREEPARRLTELFCAEIVKAPLLAQLRALDFSVVGLDLDVVRPAYPLLRHLHLLPSAETETSIEALQEIAFLLEEPATERALVVTRRVLELARTGFDRHNINRRLGTLLGLLGQLDEAIAALDASLADEPDCGATLVHKAWTLKRMGRLDEAERSVAAARKTQRHPGPSNRVTYLKLSLDLARGRRVRPELLDAVRATYLEEQPTRVVDADFHYELACLHALCGDEDDALATLATALELCEYFRGWARDEVDFRALRASPRFRELVDTGSS